MMFHNDQLKALTLIREDSSIQLLLIDDKSNESHENMIWNGGGGGSERTSFVQTRSLLIKRGEESRPD